MNGKDIFMGLGYIDQKFVEEAEHGQFPKSKSLSLRRPVMIAALIAMLLMLTGCAVVYVLSVRDMKVASIVDERPIIVDDKHTFVGMTEATYQVISLNGLKGTPNYEASREWYEFKQKFDPNHKIAIETDPWPEYPAEYDTYKLYADEMRDAVDEIAGKYDLSLAGEYIHYSFNASEEQKFLGVDHILHPDSGVNMVPFCREYGMTDNKINVWYYTGGNFTADFYMATDDGSWPHDILTVLYFMRKDVFDPAFLELDETIEWKEWVYTTKGGTEVLMLHADDSCYAYMICDREDAVITVRIDGVAEGWYEENGKTWADRDIMPQAQMEAFADAFNFDLQPNVDETLAREAHDWELKELEEKMKNK